MTDAEPRASAVGTTARLAAFVADQPGARIPPAVLGRMAECLMDFAGLAAYAGRFADSSSAFRAGARSLEPQGAGFTVVGDAGTWSQAQAALLNGALAHTMDFDDTHGASALHPGAPVIAAALGWAERSSASGGELLEAIALGYEVACRVAAALTMKAYDRGFHLTGVAGLFGAVAAGARLQRLDESIVQAAFGLAGSLASGSMQYLECGAWNKRLHPGVAAQSALSALAFAQAGVRASKEPLTGRWGVMTAYSSSTMPALLTEELGSHWLAGDTAIKPYPSCRANHSAIDAALALRRRCPADARPGARLRVELARKAYDLVGEPVPNKIAPRNAVNGQFSVYFQVACAWLDGAVNWQSYDRLGAADVEALAHNIDVTIDDTLPVLGCRLALIDAPQLTQEVLAPAGEPANPLTAEQVRTKFLSLASPVYGEAQAQALSQRLLDSARELSAADLVTILRGPA